MAAPAYPRGLGLPRSAGDDHGSAIHIALPWEALQLWLSGVPESGGSSRALEATEAGRDWRPTHGRLHDGSRSERERAGLSSSGLHLLFFRRIQRTIALGGRHRSRRCLEPCNASISFPVNGSSAVQNSCRVSRGSRAPVLGIGPFVC